MKTPTLEMTLFGPCSEYPSQTVVVDDTLAVLDESGNIRIITVAEHDKFPYKGVHFVSYITPSGNKISVSLRDCYWLQIKAA